MPSVEAPKLLYGLNDKPSNTVSFIAGCQHFLAVFGGIITAPLIMAKSMGLSAVDTNYLITSALLISGCATLIQITRIGPVGSGLLSIQGTSFTFIGPILFAFFSLPEQMPNTDKLAVIFGSSALCIVIVLPLCYYIHLLKKVFTPNVTGATIILIGLTLVWTTLNNLAKQYSLAQSSAGEGWLIVLLASLVFCVTVIMAVSKNSWLRLASITSGLALGFVVALFMDRVDFAQLNELNTTFTPEPFRYGMSFDLGVFLLLLPVFFVTATESVGDLTATCNLSGLKTYGRDYWKRIKGGLLGDVLNSLIAVCFASFPNTTFSQNNGVIRLTGIASRKVGYFVAVMLIIIGFFPIIGGLFQIIPAAVVYGSTILMFALVAFSGVDIVKRAGLSKRSLVIVILAVVSGLVLSNVAQSLTFMSAEIRMLISFPISTGAFTAIILELIIPDREGQLREELLAED